MLEHRPSHTFGCNKCFWLVGIGLEWVKDWNGYRTGMGIGLEWGKDYKGNTIRMGIGLEWG